MSSGARRYNRIVQQWLNTAWRVARRMGVDDAELDDVVQEVFLIVARRMSDIRPEAERAFVAAVAARVATNWRRSARRRPEEPVSWLEQLPCLESDVGYEPVERRQGLALVQRSLELMTNGQREVFLLAELEQLTAGEIAAQLGLEEAAVVSRLRRSRETFRRFCIRQQEGGRPKVPSVLEVG